ncbi:MAG: hypothetical protein KGN76_12225 [Acidobacteriota bacterium]|nr:hypothetical protein [Acidobacteriota bacterium]
MRPRSLAPALVLALVAGLQAGPVHAAEPAAVTVATAQPAATAPASAAGTSADPAPAPAWKPTLKIGGYVQGEFDGGARGDTRFPASDRFFVRRARVTFSGAVLPHLLYRIQADFAGGLGSASTIKGAMTDGYVEWTQFAHAHVRVGQFKAPFGYEWLVAATQIVTAERTLVTDRLSLNRQIGAQVLGAFAQGRLGYRAGIFNGNGRNTTANDNGKFMYVVRGTAIPWRAPHGTLLQVGADAYWSTDTALSMPKDFGLDSTPGTPAADSLFTGKRVGVGADGHFESGAWRMDAEFLRVRFQQQNGVVQPDVVARGWYLSPGAFVYRRLVQVVGRYETFRPDEAIAGNQTKTWLAGVNYYARGTNAKLAVDYLWVDAPGDPGEHSKVLAQIQVVF